MEHLNPKNASTAAKWFFLTSFVAGVFVSLFWSSLIVFAIVTHKMRFVLLAPLVFFIFATREVFRYYREERAKSVQEQNHGLTLD